MRFRNVPETCLGCLRPLGLPESFWACHSYPLTLCFSSQELESERKADEEELAQQYELIIQECGHGRFQWALFFVLGMALMADGVEVFVVGFVLPSAETDLCIPNSGSGWLGECTASVRQILNLDYLLSTVNK